MTTSYTITADLLDDLVGVVTFENGRQNFFSLELIRDLADHYDDLFKRGARALVLQSAGSVFCAGQDFRNTSGGKPSDLYAEALRLFRAPVPVIAAVQGAAIGGGLGLALSADFRIATPQARFAANFALIGIHQGFGLSATLPSLVGPQFAADLLYTGRRVKAEEALKIGLTDALVEAEALREAAIERARAIAAAAPLAVRSIRTTLREPLVDSVAEAVDHEQKEQLILFSTQDFREGVSAVNERRPGKFIGA